LTGVDNLFRGPKNLIAISYVTTFLINEGIHTDFLLLNQDQIKHVVNPVAA